MALYLETLMKKDSRKAKNQASTLFLPCSLAETLEILMIDLDWTASIYPPILDQSCPLLLSLLH